MLFISGIVVNMIFSEDIVVCIISMTHIVICKIIIASFVILIIFFLTLTRHWPMQIYYMKVINKTTINNYLQSG